MFKTQQTATMQKNVLYNTSETETTAKTCLKFKIFKNTATESHYLLGHKENTFSGIFRRVVKKKKKVR